MRLPTGRHRLVAAHYLAWTFAFGPVPPGIRVLHTCSLRTCMQPQHLVLSNQTTERALIQAGTWQPRGVPGQRNGRSVLTEDDVRLIRQGRARGERVRVLAARFDVSPSDVSAICRRERWKHVA